MPSSFNIEVAQQNTPVTVLRLSGRMESAGAQELLDKALELRRGGENTLVLVMSEVEFLASSGLGALVLLTEELRDRGGQLIITDLPQIVSEVINMLNLDQILHIEESLDCVVQPVVC